MLMVYIPCFLRIRKWKIGGGSIVRPLSLVAHRVGSSSIASTDFTLFAGFNVFSNIMENAYNKASLDCGRSMTIFFRM
jgi:hypothetical protein